jgi:glutathione S-transferase
MLKLYDYPLSGNCYKVRLLLSLMDQPFEAVPIDFFPGREHKQEPFLALNPCGQIPVLTDGEFVLRDSGAILVYLASQFDSTRQWFPTSHPATMGAVVQWLAHADEITATASAARLHDMLNYDLDVDAARAGAHGALRILDDHLTEREFCDGQWLVGETPTIADIACFPYTAMAGDGGVSIDNYHAVGRWLVRVKRLPGFITMPGIHPVFGDDPAT